MGNYCAANPKFKEDFQFVREYENKTFGFIRIVRNEKLNKDIAIKQLTFNTREEMQEYINFATLAKQYANVPTLLRLQGFTVENRINCSPYSVIINFDYIEKNFDEVLFEKKVKLSEYLNRNKKNIDLSNLERIRLFEYDKIDQLNYNDRKYINLFFLEAEILRMIDHIIGAIYFLNHFNNEHSAIRPQNILVDQEGKYILVDKNVLKLKTNYQLIFKDKIQICYISPQQFKNLMMKNIEPKHIAELSDIFAVGLIALEMATLQPLKGIYDFHNWKFNRKELQRLIDLMKSKYSEDFSSLIKNMLMPEENQRMNFSNLIDKLTPVLSRNLIGMEKVYGGNVIEQISFENQSDQITSENLYQKLTQIQQSYHKVMSNKMLNESTQINEDSLRKDEQRILYRLKLLNLKNDNKIKQGRQREEQTEMGGHELYELYLKQYESIKRSRQKRV